MRVQITSNRSLRSSDGSIEVELGQLAEAEARIMIERLAAYLSHIGINVVDQRPPTVRRCSWPGCTAEPKSARADYCLDHAAERIRGRSHPWKGL